MDEGHMGEGAAGSQYIQGEGPEDLLDTSVLADRGKAFDLFRCSETLLAETQAQLSPHVFTNFPVLSVMPTSRWTCYL